MIIVILQSGTHKRPLIGELHPTVFVVKWIIDRVAGEGGKALRPAAVTPEMNVEALRLHYDLQERLPKESGACSVGIDK